MSSFQLAPLMAVQERRVEAAMAEVRARNEALRHCESARQAAYKRVEEAFDASRKERTELYASLAEPAAAAAATRLIHADERRIWWRQRIVDLWKEFQKADQELTRAQADAAQAQQAYRRALAREEALTTLKTHWQAEQAVKNERSQEQVVEDLLGSRFGSSR